MGNLLQGPARVLAPSPPPSAFAPMHRFPGFVATNAQLLKAVHHRRALGAAASHRVHGCCKTRTFTSKKRPLGALSPEVQANTHAGVLLILEWDSFLVRFPAAVVVVSLAGTWQEKRCRERWPPQKKKETLLLLLV